MTIFNANWRRTWEEDVYQRLQVAHEDWAAHAAFLRDVTKDVWTTAPDDPQALTPGVEIRSLEGWRVHYRDEFQRLTAFSTANGTALGNFDAQGKAALDGYLASLPAINTAFQAALAKHTHQGALKVQRVAQADRDAIATAIEAELQ